MKSPYHRGRCQQITSAQQQLNASSDATEGIVMKREHGFFLTHSGDGGLAMTDENKSQ